MLCARVLWTFSAAAHRLGDCSHLVPARHAYDYLMTHFLDPAHGGVFWTVDKAGVAQDDRKQIYAQAFAIYALAEYSRARGLAEPLRTAMGLVELIEAHAADPAHGGYIEGCDRNWDVREDMRLSPRDLQAPKSMNTLLHLMEAYTTLWEVASDPVIRELFRSLTCTVLDHVFDARSGRFWLFFDLGWTPLSSTVSPGHDIESAWLVVAAARAVGDAELIARAESAALSLAETAARTGRDADGAIVYEIQHPGSDTGWRALTGPATGGSRRRALLVSLRPTNCPKTSTISVRPRAAGRSSRSTTSIAPTVTGSRSWKPIADRG